MAAPKLDEGRPVDSVAEMRKENPWLASEDILGHRVTVEIEDVRMHSWLGKSEYGLHFVGKKKPLLLNATNRYTLSVRLGLGRDVRRWVGCRIILAAEGLAREFAGRTMGIRVQADAEAKALIREGASNAKG